MAGRVSGGQTLTPNPNVVAPAGRGDGRWGANGGGITPIGGGNSGQTGWDTPEAEALARGITATTYQFDNNKRSVEAGLSNTAIKASVADSSLPSGNSNSG